MASEDEAARLAWLSYTWASDFQVIQTTGEAMPESHRRASESESVVQRQLDAYNAHDLDSFVATYSDEVEIFRLPSTVAALSGKQELREFYQKSRFNLPALHAVLLHRSVVGNRVIDHERIVGLGAEPVETVAEYLVQDGLIQKVWLRSGS